MKASEQKLRMVYLLCDNLNWNRNMLNKIITMLRISEVFRQKRPFPLKRIENKIELFILWKEKFNQYGVLAVK